MAARYRGPRKDILDESQFRVYEKQYKCKVELNPTKAPVCIVKVVNVNWKVRGKASGRRVLNSVERTLVTSTAF